MNAKGIKKITGLILFGDSVFFGAGASSKDFGCGRLLKKMLDIPVLIRSRNRDTTTDALRRIGTCEWDTSTFSHVIIMFGNNDCRLIDINKTQVGIEEYKNNLKTIVSWFLARGFSSFLTNLQPIDDNEFQKQLSGKQYDNFIATHILTKETPSNWQKKYSDACIHVAKDVGLPIIDIRTPLEVMGRKIIASDGLHPNDLGHQITADIIKNYISGLTQ